jgi:uncharacterized protein (UPF0212 family)
MEIHKTPMRCVSCDHHFEAETVVKAPVNVYLASLKALSCPKCGAGFHSIAFVVTADDGDHSRDDRIL